MVSIYRYYDLQSRFQYAQGVQRLLLMAVIFSVAGLFAPAMLFAKPAPIPEDELMARCDLVVSADIVSVRRLSPQQCSLLARAKVLEAHKGSVVKGSVLNVYFGLPSGTPGDSGIAIYAGEQLKLYLLKNEAGTDDYHPFAHNEAELLQGVDPARQILPQRLGEVIYAPGQQPTSSVSTTRPRRFRIFNRR